MDSQVPCGTRTRHVCDGHVRFYECSHTYSIARVGAVRVPYDRRAAPLRAGKVFDTAKIVKSHTGVVYGRVGAVRYPCDPCRGCSWAVYDL